jgi:NADH dehydrogenase (ubiquinone) 1 beta subcomplex subunit 7
MAEAKLPLAYRDSCAHLLIPLNKCRYDEYYLPWKCEVRPRGRASRSNLKKLTLSAQNERHSYEKCQYEEFKKRVAKMDEIRASKGGARSN